MMNRLGKWSELPEYLPDSDEEEDLDSAVHERSSLSEGFKPLLPKSLGLPSLAIAAAVALVLIAPTFVLVRLKGSIAGVCPHPEGACFVLPSKESKPLDVPVTPGEGEGGRIKPIWLFLPCEVDGFWSNMRQYLLFAFAASQMRDSIRWVPPHVFFQVQDGGFVYKTSPPLELDVLFDRSNLANYVDMVSSREFFQECYDTVEFQMWMFRCDDRKWLTYEPWLDLYRLPRRPNFVPSIWLNGTKWPQLQQDILNVSSCSTGSRFLAKGLPHVPWDPWTFDVMVNRGGHVHQHLGTQPMKETPFGAFLANAVRFAPAVQTAADLIMARLNLTGSQDWVALHIRDGYSYRTYFGSDKVAKLGEVLKTLNLVEQPRRCGVDTRRIVLSIVDEKAKKRWVHNLQRDGRRTVSWFNESIWDMVGKAQIPGLYGNDHSGLGTILESLVEMEIWKRAPAFVGTRSTMSEFVFLWRGASGREKARCTFSAQPDWTWEPEPNSTLYRGSKIYEVPIDH